MKKLKVGVLGLGSIFHRVMTDFPNAKNCELYAVAARDSERAKAEAVKYGAAKAYGSYEELVNDPEVDMVYVATPHRFHKEHTLMSLQHGKHVLCEKPFAMNAKEAEEMIACAREKGLFLMEAMWTRFLPTMRALVERIEAGEFGRVLHIAGDFAYAAYPEGYNPDGRLFSSELGGGALMDVGPYVLSVGAMLLGAEVTGVQCSALHAPTGVDKRTVLQLQYPDEATAQYMVAVDVQTPNNMTLFAEKAIVELPYFWGGNEIRINGETVLFPRETEGHHHEFDAAALDIFAGRTENAIMPLDETLQLMRLLDEIREKIGVHFPADEHNK